MKRIKSLVILSLLLISFGASAQSQSSMRINEVLVTNTEDMQDDFGQQSAWIELSNTSYGTVDLAGCYLTDNPADLKKYRIPKGDLATKVKPRQFVVFWADGKPERGTFHTNLQLVPGGEVILVGGDGKTVLDKITIPATLGENQSYGRTDNGRNDRGRYTESWMVLNTTSPGVSNMNLNATTKSQRMGEIDPHGWIMAVTAMSVVFIALIILYFIIKNLIRLLNREKKPKSEKKEKIEVKPEKKHIAAKAPKGKEAEAAVAAAIAMALADSDETYAAISTALYLYENVDAAHDVESGIITIRPVKSNWNNHQMRENPQIKRK